MSRKVGAGFTKKDMLDKDREWDDDSINRHVAPGIE
jgi:hypothetical protein